MENLGAPEQLIALVHRRTARSPLLRNKEQTHKHQVGMTCTICGPTIAERIVNDILDRPELVELALRQYQNRKALLSTR